MICKRGCRSAAAAPLHASGVDLDTIKPTWLTAVPRFYEKIWTAVESLDAGERVGHLRSEDRVDGDLIRVAAFVRRCSSHLLAQSGALLGIGRRQPFVRRVGRGDGAAEAEVRDEAVDAPGGVIWMLPFPAAKAASHWRAAWDERDVRAVIADLARLHAAFWEHETVVREWDWLLRPVTEDAARLLADGREGLDALAGAGAYDDILTPGRVHRLLALARDPDSLLEALIIGPQTLLHGDAGFQNIAITRDGRERIWYDWQLAGWGPPALDWATFLHPWGYPEAHPPLPAREMTSFYLHELRRRGAALAAKTFMRQLDVAFLWRWLIQWGPLLGTYRDRLRPEVRERLGRVFAQYQWPALMRLTSEKDLSG